MSYLRVVIGGFVSISFSFFLVSVLCVGSYVGFVCFRFFEFDSVLLGMICRKIV